MVVVLDVVCSCMLLVGCGLLNVVVCCMLLGCCAGRMIQPVHSVHPLQLLSAKIVDGREKMDQNWQLVHAVHDAKTQPKYEYYTGNRKIAQRAIMIRIHTECFLQTVQTTHIP